MAKKSEMVVTMAGDCLMNHRMSVYTEEQFMKLAELIRNSDFAIANMEICVQDGPEDSPALVGAGGALAGYQGNPPFLIDELKWFGFNSVFTANNHAQDFGEGGVMTTLRHLDAAGMTHAGTGRNLTAATAPSYTDSPHGRVGVVCAADWGPRGAADLPYPVPLGALAADQGAMYKDRPGVNLLRYDVVQHVDKASLDALRRIGKELHWDEAKAARSRGTGGRSEPLVAYTNIGREIDGGSHYYFAGTKYVEDDTFTFETDPYEVDLERNYKWIREASGQADTVIAGIHQQGAGRYGEIPDHTRIFAHGAIDNGADVFAAHGKGRMGGVEIYKGKAILYGLPGFIMQLNQVRHQPLELLERWGLGYGTTALEFLEHRDKSEATGGLIGTPPSATGGGMAVISAVFEQDRSLKEIRIHPIELTRGSRASMGRPMLCEPGGPVFNAVLESATKQSAEYGTKVEVKDGVGVIRVQ